MATDRDTPRRRWVRQLDRFVPAALLDGANPDDLRRARATVAATSVSACGFAASGVVRLASSDGLEGVIGLASGATFALIPVLLRRTGSLFLAGNLLAFQVFAIMIGLTAVSGGGFPGLLFGVSLVPAAAVLVAGWRSGIVWAVATCVAIEIVALLAASGFQFPYTADPSYLVIGRFHSAAILVLVVLATALVYDGLKNAALDDLAASERRFRTLVERSPLGVAAVDRDGRIVSANEATCVMVGAPDRAALVGRNVFDDEVLVETGIAALFEQCLHRDEPAGGTVAFRSAWGRDLEVRLRIVPLHDAAGAVDGAEAIVEDVTDERRLERERRRFQEQIAHTQKLRSIGVLAGGVAHDFNNLLTVILGNTSLVLRQLGSDEPMRRKLEQVEASASHAARLTSQLLAYAGQGQVTTEPIDLSALVADLSELVDAAVPRSVRVERRLVAGLPLVDADVGELRQVVMNLVANAAEAISAERPGRVTITTGTVTLTAAEASDNYLGEALAGGSYVVLEVADDGAGIDAERLRKVFDPFYTTKVMGRGLGLSSVLGIVRAHRGTVRVESAVGAGTTMRVLLPATDRARAAVGPVGTPFAPLPARE